jgi:hypothetical protein
MVETCMDCHSPRLAEKTLEQADAAAGRQRALKAEAESIVRALESDGIISGSVEDGPRASLRRINEIAHREGANPFHRFRPDGAEAIPGDPLAVALESLKAEASLLRRIKTLEERVENLAAAARPRGSESRDELLKKELRTLRDRFLSGEISKGSYKKQKNRLLDGAGL